MGFPASVRIQSPAMALYPDYYLLKISQELGDLGSDDVRIEGCLSVNVVQDRNGAVALRRDFGLRVLEKTCETRHQGNCHTPTTAKVIKLPIKAHVKVSG